MFRYDQEVLNSARRTASREGAIQRDMLIYFKDSYVSEDVHNEIADLMYSLPRRRKCEVREDQQ